MRRRGPISRKGRGEPMSLETYLIAMAGLGLMLLATLAGLVMMS